jgi:hypothetical protein
VQGSRIYYDFSPEVAWIRQKVAHDLHLLGPSAQSSARFYTEERLRILQGRVTIRLTDRRMGSPVPYLAFWFADALGLDVSLRRLSALSLVYNTIAVTVRDDIADSESANNPGNLEFSLYWYRKYIETLREVFPSEREFRKVISWAEAEGSKFEEWNSAPMGDSYRRPYSADFLADASRYLVAGTLPTLIAIAHAAGRKAEVPRIKSFLTTFSMGWKIFDDLMDWKEDLAIRDMNRSSVLIYVWNKMGNKYAVDRLQVLSWFLDKEFVRDAYGAMIGYLLKAKKSVSSLSNFYLDRFMEDQIGLQTDKMNSLIGLAESTLSDINEHLTSVLGPMPPSGRLTR